ncbi:hypothetical protein [Saccharothrix sp. HUAS TT1]|uniref:hypothetical protein n=1 Tax=unclassified Saccharothrix TaxID=2593673 RepID=UPI00345BE68C
MTYEFCKVFVKDLDVRATADVLADLGLPLNPPRFPGDGCAVIGPVVLEVGVNHAGGEASSEDDFVVWPVHIELGPISDDPGVSDAELAVTMVETTAIVVRGFWDRGHPVVAACDYEDNLPWNGGIGRISTR